MYLDELINVTNSWHIVRDEWFQRCFQLQHLRLVLQNVLEDILHFFIYRQIFKVVWIVSTCKWVS